MNDLIERQAAIDTLNVGAELLRRVLDDADVVGAERAKYEWGLGLIESYISDMKELPPAQQEQRWIPCKERQPEEDGAYLVTLVFTDTHGIEHRYTSIQEFKYGMWVIFGMCSIEAWIPLPEPYKEE